MAKLADEVKSLLRSNDIKDKKLHDIYLLIEGHIDGAEDASSISKLCNQIGQIIDYPWK